METVLPLRYRGQSNQYVDIAVRNEEHLGFSVEYAAHPTTHLGYFILRFVVHGKGVDPKNYKHLTYRESAKFLIPQTDTTSAEVFEGVRLNKLAIPVFDPAVQKYEVDKFALKFGIWALLTEWVAEQAQSEGFTVTVDLQQEIRSYFIPPQTPEEKVKSVIEFPDLTDPKQKAAALKLVQKPKSYDVEEALDDEDDEAEEDDEESIN